MAFAILIGLGFAPAASAEMLEIPSGTYQPFFKDEGLERVPVQRFRLDKTPVTNRDFNQFLTTHPDLRKSKIARIFADANYLGHWGADLMTESELKSIGDSPVVNVSWFTARRYCASQGKRLATIREWEYAADSENADEQAKILEWYGKPSDQLPAKVGLAKPNRYGLHDMNGLIWEWVEDFNSVMISSDSRSKGARTEGLFCGGGSVSARDSSQYATFMRFAFRSGLKGPYTSRNLGFRCASDIAAAPSPTPQSKGDGK